MELDAGQGLDAEVRVSRSGTRVADWALVLHAMDIDHRIEARDGVVVLLVSPRDHGAALAALDAFDLENMPVVEQPAPDLGPSPLGIGLALLIVWMYVVAGPRDGGAASRWFDVGTASAARIVAGEWWRAVTALTLHADLMHLVGNVAASLLFVSAVGRWLGVGLGAAIVLASAAAANTLTAWTYGMRHESVGASTATFAALGVLAGLQMVRRLRHLTRRRRHAWVPIGAGLGLLVLLGTSERADVVGHLYGLVAGVGAGAAVGAAGVRAPGRFIQSLLTAVTLAVVAGAWWVGLQRVLP